MKEVTCQLNQQENLKGILVLPQTINLFRDCVIFINAGLVSMTGPYRLYTELSRLFAKQGILSLRFDLGGIGDSQIIRKDLLLKERTFSEIQSAVDTIEKNYDCTNITLIGLCSGAEDSFIYAEHDERIKRVILIDPFAYKTSGHLWRHLLFRLRRKSLYLLGLFHKMKIDINKSLIDYKIIPHNESSRILAQLIKRSVQLHFFYTGGTIEYFNHVGQFKKMFPDIDLKNLVTVDFLPNLGHTQGLKSERELLGHTILKRVMNN